MKQSEYITRVIEPQEGMVLTQFKDVKLEDRIFSEKIFLAVNDSPSNWKEITEEEANKLKEEQEKLRKENTNL